MKRMLGSLFLIVFLFAACDSPEPSISRVEDAPDKIQEAIDPAHSLQMISDGGNASYIVYKSDKAVEADIGTEGNILTIKLDEEGQQGEESKYHVFKLITGSDIDTIDVEINGKHEPLDVVTYI